MTTKIRYRSSLDLFVEIFVALHYQRLSPNAASLRLDMKRFLLQLFHTYSVVMSLRKVSVKIEKSS